MACALFDLVALCWIWYACFELFLWVVTLGVLCFLELFGGPCDSLLFFLMLVEGVLGACVDFLGFLGSCWVFGFCVVSEFVVLRVLCILVLVGFRATCDLRFTLVFVELGF